jgi:hypothetical protein
MRCQIVVYIPQMKEHFKDFYVDGRIILNLDGNGVNWAEPVLLCFEYETGL